MVNMRNELPATTTNQQLDQRMEQSQNSLLNTGNQIFTFYSILHVSYYYLR
jgi:hypothetical protein